MPPVPPHNHDQPNGVSTTAATAAAFAHGTTDGTLSTTTTTNAMPMPAHAHLSLPGAAAYSAAPASPTAPLHSSLSPTSPSSLGTRTPTTPTVPPTAQTPSTPCADERISDEAHATCCGAMVEPYLTRGYRTWCRGSLVQCALSVFQRHNETVNIWSHGLACLYMLRVAYRTYHGDWRQRHHGLPAATRVLWHGLACAATFGVSAVAHTFSAYSPHWSRVLFGVDRAMIAVLLMICTHLSAGLRWSSDRAVVVRTRDWLFAVTSLTGLIAATALARDSLFTPATKVAVMGAQLGLSALPVMAEVVRYRHVAPGLARSVAWSCFQVLALAGVGGGLYASRVPERFAPGRFDLVGASHQLMHFFVVASAYTAFHGTKRWADAQTVARPLLLARRN